MNPHHPPLKFSTHGQSIFICGHPFHLSLLIIFETVTKYISYSVSFQYIYKR